MSAPQPLPLHDSYDDNLLTGKFVCTLTTASPLYVRAMQTVEQFKNSEVPSESAYGKNKNDLIIPGSSLRGMLRTMVEIVSHGRIAPVTDKSLFFRTVDMTSVGDSYNERMRGKVCGWFFRTDGNRFWIESCPVVS